MVKIILKHLKLSQNDLTLHTELIHQKMNNNPTYVELQPLVTALRPLIDAYTAAILNAADGGKDRTKAKNKAKDELNKLMTKLAKTMEINANDQAEGEGEDFATNACFQIQEASTKKKVTVIEVPSNFNVVNDSKKGVIILTWERVEGAITYAFEELEDNGSWKNGRYCNQTSMTLSGFTLGAKKIFRIKAIGPETKTSEWSEPVEVWIS